MRDQHKHINNAITITQQTRQSEQNNYKDEKKLKLVFCSHNYHRCFSCSLKILSSRNCNGNLVINRVPKKLCTTQENHVVRKNAIKTPNLIQLSSQLGRWKTTGPLMLEGSPINKKNKGQWLLQIATEASQPKGSNHMLGHGTSTHQLLPQKSVVFNIHLMIFTHTKLLCWNKIENA